MWQILPKKENREKIKGLSQTPSPNGSKVFYKCVILFCSIEIILKCKEISCPTTANVCNAPGVLICGKYLNDSVTPLVKTFTLFLCFPVSFSLQCNIEAVS